MRYLSAYVLSALGGNNEPEAEDLETILKSVGAEFENDKAKELVSAIDGKDFNDLVSAGLKKMSSVPTGGAAAPTSAAAAPGPAAAKEEAKEEAKESSESEEEMGFGLFD